MNRFYMALALLLISAGATQSPDGNKPSRPGWIEQARESRLQLHSELIVSERWATKGEARRDAVERAALRAGEFAAEAEPRIRDAWPVPMWFIQDHMLREPIFVEEIDWTYGPMYQAYLLLDLAPAKRELILSQWHSTIVQKRMNQVGGGLGFLLICVATLLGYLRLDDATRGYYTRWLATGAVAVVVASAAAVYRWIG
jgi:hypothetical protein